MCSLPWRSAPTAVGGSFPGCVAVGALTDGLHPPRDGPSSPEWFNGFKKAEWVFVIAAYILIQTEAGQAATAAAALRAVPGVSETACQAGPYDVIARAQARNIDELAKLVTSQVQALDGVSRTMSCPVVHL